VKVAQWLAGLLAAIAILAVVVAWTVRLMQPVEYVGRGRAIADAVSGVLLFLASLAVVHWFSPRPQEKRSFEKAVRDYSRGSLIGVGLNAAALLQGASAVMSGGLGGGLWLPLLVVTALNGFGLVLAWPRIRMLRELHFAPSLPYAR
jgi:hypothetical protein